MKVTICKVLTAALVEGNVHQGLGFSVPGATGSPTVNTGHESLPNFSSSSLATAFDSRARSLPLPKGKRTASRLQACWAKTGDEVREAQRLRYDVFSGELGASLGTALAGHDVDRFDDYCEHLLVRDAVTQQVVGTYRLLAPAQARRVGSTFCDEAFDLAPLAALRSKMIELGRSCVRPGYRQGGVILSLWSALAEFMQRNRLETMIGCASMPPGEGHAAAIWRKLRKTHLSEAPCQVLPRLPLPLDAHDDHVRADPPALVRAYLRLGATVLGPPAWDPAFKTADLLMMMRTADLPAHYLRSVKGG